MMVFPGLSPGARSPINRGKPQSPQGVDTVDSALFAPQNIFYIFPHCNSWSFQIHLGPKTINVGKSMKDEWGKYQIAGVHEMYKSFRLEKKLWRNIFKIMQTYH